MPGLNGTGPMSEGPMTGGGFGYCGTSRRPAYGLGGGAFCGGRFRGGRGFGRGVGRGFAYERQRRLYGSSWAANTRTGVDALRQEANDLKAHLKDVEARIAELGEPAAE